MTDIVRSHSMATSVEDVWSVLADYSAIDTWAPQVDHSCLLTRADVELGEGLGLTRRIQTGRMTLLERVVVWEAPATLAYDITGLPPIVRSARNRWDIVSTGAGVVVTLTSSFDVGARPPAQLVARIVGKRLAKASESMLSGLAVHLGKVAHV